MVLQNIKERLNCIANENYTFRAGYGFAIRSPY